MKRRLSRRWSQTCGVCSRTCSRSAVDKGGMRARSTKAVDGIEHVVDHLWRQGGIDADPEQPLHHEISIHQRADHTMGDLRIGGLPEEVSREQKPGPNLARFEVTDKFVARKGSFPPHRDRESKPTRLRIRSRLR